MRSCEVFCGLLLLLLPITGCSCTPQHRQPKTHGNEIARSVASAFEPQPSRVFLAKGALGNLLTHLDYDAQKYSYHCDHAADGASLRCWNSDRTSAVVIHKGSQARVLATPQGAFLDDHDNLIAWRDWYGRRECDNTVSFQGGIVLFAPELCVDSGGRYLCYGGDYYDYTTHAKQTTPIKLAFVGDPLKPVAISKLQGLLAGVFADGNRIYIVAQDSGHLLCEEYERDGPAVAKKREFEIRPPAKLAVAWVVPADYDPITGSFLVQVGRDLPLLGGPIWYVYDIKTDKFREIGIFEGYAGFLDREIFDRALEDASTRPSRP